MTQIQEDVADAMTPLGLSERRKLGDPNISAVVA
jgi:hypothetical protein